MKKILFVEDQPSYKLDVIFYFFKRKNVSFEYEIVESITEAKLYLRDKNNKVDLVVTDLGLPTFNGEMVTNLLAGMDIVCDMDRFNKEVPVIINSTTMVPDFKRVKEEYDERNQKLYKVDSIMQMKEWLVEFLSE